MEVLKELLQAVRKGRGDDLEAAIVLKKSG